MNRILAFLRPQPAPVRALVCHLCLPRFGQVVTAISRVWAEGDASRCRLCDRCTAVADECLVQVSGFISREEAALFSTVGMRRQDPTDRPGPMTERGASW